MTHLELVSDCSRCFGLCCVLLPFRAGSGFGTDKDGGTPCHHLQDDDACGIHDRLRERGWPGCTVFECFGAGQRVSQGTYAGTSWREHDNLGEMSAVLSAMRQLHEMLVHLAEVDRRSPAATAAGLAGRIAALGDGDAESVLGIDLDELRAEVGAELRIASLRLRGAGDDREGTDLSGRDLRDVLLVRASLRGALLLGADLRSVDLTLTDVLGADLRGADLRGADLAGAVFLTQPQVNAARGDTATRLPAGLARPGHWA
ncbi:pentapeptide repeat-containing protein [uncultured Nocardioides sp.]|uniref:pentapeptide repeat-containing protein n=1 Tax=uncultured Nocardioides sp. TaxID=198441 RepID=UPI0025F17E1B|nr:pentapeptide repeat-containing protein [uncultured Nocardioides sp.]